MLATTTAIILDTRYKRKDGCFPIKLRLTFNREQKYYSTGISLTTDDWEKTLIQKPRNEAKENRIYFNKIEQKAIDIIKEIDPFSFAAFEKKFNQKTDRTKSVLGLFDAYIDQLKKEGRSGTASSYQCARNSLTGFLEIKNRKKLPFADVTPEWLTSYENWMLSNGSSLTTVGIYLRSLRTILNMAIDEGLSTREFYPFGKRKYVIPAGSNIKKALTIADIKKIVNYKPKTDAEQRAKDLWIFSYLCNGANVKDIARLQYKNVDKSKITFIRAKTERTTKQSQRPILIVLLPEIKAIIERWGVKPITPETFVFGILEKSDSSEVELKKVRQAVKTINNYMKRIGESLGFDLKLTTYTARHSFATVLKRSGAPTEFISESLGHKDLRTTENYLDSFEDNVKESYQKQLLNFD